MMWYVIKGNRSRGYLVTNQLCPSRYISGPYETADDALNWAMHREDVDRAKTLIFWLLLGLGVTTVYAVT